jgi:hypothetical protein
VKTKLFLLLMVLALGLAHAQTITTFDAPGAGTGSEQGTQPLSINAANEIVGSYTDVNYGYHGFIRAANGAITDIDIGDVANSCLGQQRRGNDDRVVYRAVRWNIPQLITATCALRAAR